MQAVAEIEAVAIRPISMGGGQGETGRFDSWRQIAKFDPTVIDNFNNDWLDVRNGADELVGPGQTDHGLEHRGRRSEGVVCRGDRLGSAVGLRLVCKDGLDRLRAAQAPGRHVIARLRPKAPWRRELAPATHPTCGAPRSDSP